MAVGRFVKVGEAIANENWDLKEEINIACIEAKQAGMWILISKPIYTNLIALDMMANYCLILSVLCFSPMITTTWDTKSLD